jgi:hypothetical protein
MSDFILPEDYRTLRQAANEKGCSYDALRLYVRLHNVPTARVGKTLVVRLSDLVSYVPRGTKQVLAVC